MKLAHGWEKRAWAEAIGTFTLVFAGCGSIMVSERFPGSIAPEFIAISFGLAITVMIYSVGHISGAHFNPAVTLGFAVSGKFPKNEVPIYWAAQFASAILGIAVLALILPNGSGYGATLPRVPEWQATLWELILTFFLMFVILSVATDTRAHKALAGLAIGATISLDAVVGGPVTGASMNPARTLAPALWEGHLNTIWIYFLGPAAGAALAAFTYEQIR